MVERYRGMDPLPTCATRRRGLSLVVAGLCVLAVLAGAAVRSSEVSHHRAHVLAVASATTDLHLTAARALDSAPSASTASPLTAVFLARAAERAPAPASTAPGTVRNRGPPTA